MATVPAIAGCLGDDDAADTDDTDDANGIDDTDDANGIDDTDDTEDPDDEQAQETYDAALAELVAVAETLDEFTRDDVDPEQGEVDELDGRLDTAESLLDEAADENPSAALQERIDAARSIAAFQRELVGYNALVVEYNGFFESAFDYWGLDEYNAAASDFLDAATIVGDIRTQVDAIDTAHGGLEHGVVDEPALNYSENFWEYVGVDSVEEVDAIHRFTIGLNEFLVGLDLVVSGEEAYEQERFETARDLFEGSHLEMSAARDSFASVVDDPVLEEEDRNDVVAFLELVEPWVDATAKFREAADLAMDGDIEAANERYEDGVELLPD